jgi:putative holliday junction resolvase
MRPGRRMAIDVGKARIGVAVCDREAILSSPLEPVSRSSSLLDTAALLKELVQENEIFEVYVGDPLSLAGSETQSTADARAVATELAKLLSVSVRLVDERLTTVSAASKLRAAGFNAKSSKSMIDSASAVEILESALAFERSSGSIPGKEVGDSVGA